MSFNDKVCLITGSSNGIGKAIAIHLAKEKAKVILIGRDIKALEEVKNICTNLSGHETVAVKADVSKDEEIVRIIEITTKLYGKLDVLVNNAGVLICDDIFSATLENFDIHINTNLKSVFNLTRLCVPLLIQTQGNIVNISGVQTVKYIKGLLTLGLSKVAIEHFTKCIAYELGPKKVRANSLVLGYVENTKIIERANLDPEEFGDEFKKLIPLGEFIQPEDVAETVAFIASDKAKHITGQKIIVDGGFSTY